MIWSPLWLLVGYSLGHLLWPVTVRWFLRREARRYLSGLADEHCRTCGLPLLGDDVGQCETCEMEARADHERPTLRDSRREFPQVQAHPGLVEITTLGDRYGRFMCPHEDPPCTNCVDELADRLLQERLGYGREPDRSARMFARVEARRDLT